MIDSEELTRRRRRWTSGRLAQGAASVGAVAVLAGLVGIWGARSWSGGGGYVSQLGADGSPTAGFFNTALLVLASGGALAALGLRGQRATAAVLSRWTVSATLLTAGVAFGVASRVTCTAGCPVPLTPAAEGQDLVHVVAAVTGFAAATWAMLQVGWSAVPRPLRDLSRAAAVAVALTAATGGLMSVVGLRTDVGADLEFVAMTVATSWLVVVASWASRPRPGGLQVSTYPARRSAGPRPRHDQETQPSLILARAMSRAESGA